MMRRLSWVGRRNARGAASAVAAAAFCVSLCGVTTAEARTIVVDLFGERPSGLVGQCTLREAVQAVNLQAGIQGCAAPDGDPDTILLLPGTYSVKLTGSADTLSVNRAVTIEGNGFEATTIKPASQATTLVTLFSTNASGAGVTFRGVHITGVGSGYALRVRGGVTSVYDSHISASGYEAPGFATGGCIWNEGSLYMSEVEVSQCRGWTAGAILNNSWLYLDSSSVVDTAHAARNGAIMNNGASAQLYIWNSTLANNKAVNHATALNNFGGTAEITASTIVDNIPEGASIPAINNTSGTLKIGSTLLARNTGSQCGGSITSLGYNYLGQTGSICAPTVTQATDKSGGSIGLSSTLRRFGSVTRVKVPTAAPNPILNHIPQGQCGFSDQRGLRRVDFGSNCDIGAVERGHATIVIGNTSTVPSHDTNMRQWLNDAGLDTVFVDDNSAAPNLAVSGRSLAIISTSVDDATVGTKYKNSPIGIVVNKISALDNMSMVNTGDAGVFETPAQSVAVPLDSNYFHHKIGNFPNLLNNGGGGWGNPAGSATWMVYYMFNTKPCVFRHAKGIAGALGFFMPAGRISFPGWPNLFTGSGTADGKEVFYEAVMWASTAK